MMGIGTSLGAFYDDEFHYQQSQHDPKRFDTNDENVVSPNQYGTNKALEDAELNPSTGMGLEVAYKTASPLVTITDEDIDNAMNIGMATSGGGLGTVTKGNFLKGANDNIKDIPMYGATQLDQLARKLGEIENGKGSWDRIGGGGQEHYYKDARRALRMKDLSSAD